MKPSDPEFTARMLTAELFREHLKVTGTRQAMLNDLGVDRMPVIVPALGYTNTGEIKRAAIKRFARGEQYIVVPVGLLELIPGEEQARFRLAVLTFANAQTDAPDAVQFSEIHDDTTMAELVEAITPGKVWDIRAIDTDLAAEVRTLALAGQNSSRQPLFIAEQVAKTQSNDDNRWHHN